MVHKHRSYQYYLAVRWNLTATDCGCCCVNIKMILAAVHVDNFRYLRQWICELRNRMSKEERAALPCYSEDSGIQMVNRYEDRDGQLRVSGAYSCWGL